MKKLATIFCLAAMALAAQTAGAAPLPAPVEPVVPTSLVAPVAPAAITEAALHAAMRLAANAQSGSGGTHSVGLSWGASSEVTLNTANQGYNAYRAIVTSGGSCPVVSSTNYLQINAALIQSSLTYSDAGLTAGNYCYYVDAEVNGAHSAPSNIVQVLLQPAPPGTLAGKQTQ